MANSRARACVTPKISFLSIGLTLLLAPTAWAQEGGMDPLTAIDQAFNQKITKLGNEMQTLNLGRGDCATKEGRARAQVKSQQTQGMVQAGQQLLQGGAVPLVGNLGQAIFGAGDRTKAQAKADLQSIPKEFGQFSGGFSCKEGVSATPSADAFARDFCANDANKAQYARTAPTQFDTSVPTNNCFPEVRNQAREDIQKFKAACIDFAASSSLTSETTTNAINSTVSALGAGMTLHGTMGNAKAGKEDAAVARKQCEQQLDLQLDQGRRALADLEKQKADAFLRESLRRAAADRQKPPEVTPPKDDAPIAIPGGGSLGKGGGGGGKKDDSGGGGGGSPVAGGGGGGGGTGASSDVPWTFGDGAPGAGNMGGLGGQPEGASFTAESGGGGGGGDGFGFANLDPGAGDPGLAPDGSELLGDESEVAFGDGGLNVLISRARMRYAAHAVDLVRNIDMNQMAKKAPEEPSRAPAGAPTKPVAPKRL